MEYENSLVVKTAWYYYVENMTQDAISKKLDISRMRVVKLLETARQNGIIQFKIKNGSLQRAEIEQELMNKWNLKDAYVIPSAKTGKELNSSIANAAAMYISDKISNDTFINMGYGDTPSKILNKLATYAEKPFSIVSLTGGVNYYLPNAQSNIFNAKLYLMPTPLLVSSKDMVSALKTESSVKEILRMVKLASMTVVGIGGMNENATILKSGILNKNDFLYLSMKGAVGDILSHFIDKDGNPVLTSIDERLMSISLNTLKNLDNVIGVAAGSDKVLAINAALKGGYLDILVTDEETAMQLLQI